MYLVLYYSRSWNIGNCLWCSKQSKEESCVLQPFWQIQKGLLGTNKCHSSSRQTDDLSMALFKKARFFSAKE